MTKEEEEALIVLENNVSRLLDRLRNQKKQMAELNQQISDLQQSNSELSSRLDHLEHEQHLSSLSATITGDGSSNDELLKMYEEIIKTVDEAIAFLSADDDIV